jgi:hypothetical protein
MSQWVLQDCALFVICVGGYDSRSLCVRQQLPAWQFESLQYVTASQTAPSMECSMRLPRWESSSGCTLFPGMHIILFTHHMRKLGFQTFFDARSPYGILAQTIMRPLFVYIALHCAAEAPGRFRALFVDVSFTTVPSFVCSAAG